MFQSLIALVPAFVPMSPAADREVARPAPVPVAEFVLDSARGERLSLYADRPGRVATALIFVADGCPVAKKYAATVALLAREYGEQGVTFLAIDATAGTDAARAKPLADILSDAAPLLLDPLQIVAGRLGVTKSATAVLLDGSFAPVYVGAIDDQYGLKADKPIATRDHLIEAMEAVMAGTPVEVAAMEVDGTPLGAKPPASVTYNEHVAPILHRQCVDCHRPGQVGPMALLDYADAKGWAPTIAEVVGSGRMPPWHADPRYGHFVNVRRLTDTEKVLLTRWAETGAKEGDPKKKPKAPAFDDTGWAMGKPDLVIELPKPEEIAAEGVFDYRYVMVDPKITEERWVQAVEIRPTATEQTHHVLAFYLPPGKLPVDVFSGLRDGSIVGMGYFAVQVPGNRPNVYPDDTGKRIEAGGKFLFQLHYTANGRKSTDQTRMGFQFCKTKPRREVMTRGIFHPDLKIPPNEANATFQAKQVFKKPTQLISMFPHMHTRGKAFKFEHISAEDPDLRTVVLDVPKYDFNWQNFYRPAEPIQFEAGDAIAVTAVYDNSTGNPFNPDPSKWVYWGDQTFHEMMIGYIDYLEGE